MTKLHIERFQGPVYRALNPVYAREPLSGRGAALYGGRFNSKGTSALYTSLSPATALREANQVGSLQPTVLVSYRADLGPVFDTRDPVACAQYGITPQVLSDPGWRLRMLENHEVPSQSLATRLSKDGFAGLLVPSYAKGAQANDLNLVLWSWSGGHGTLTVVDDENRLDRM